MELTVVGASVEAAAGDEGTAFATNGGPDDLGAADLDEVEVARREDALAERVEARHAVDVIARPAVVGPQVFSETGDDNATPRRVGLALQDRVPELPLQVDQRRIHLR